MELNLLIKISLNFIVTIIVFTTKRNPGSSIHHISDAMKDINGWQVMY